MSAYLAGGNLWDNGDGTKYYGYYVNAHFFRFVRPGMERVKAECADGDIMLGAFADEGAGSFSVVFIYNASSAKTVLLSASGGGLPAQLEMRRTTSS